MSGHRITIAKILFASAVVLLALVLYLLLTKRPQVQILSLRPLILKGFLLFCLQKNPLKTSYLHTSYTLL